MFKSIASFISEPLVKKVPEVTIYFWVIKLLSTALGESTSDYFVYQYNPYLVVTLGFVGLVVILLVQLLARRYIPWIYWLTVVMVAVFGTMAADVAHIVLGIPYAVTTVTFSVALAVIFLLWQKVERTLSIHSIVNRRRELFYWAVVSATFALGTAAGDLTAFTLGWGFLVSGILFAVIFAIPLLGYKILGWNGIFSFWFAYILTRPLGASFADWTGKAQSFGALGWGDGPVALVLSLLIIGLVAYLSITKIDLDRSDLDSGSL